MKAESTSVALKAVEDFVDASGRVRSVIAAGEMARGEVQQVRVAARRALGEAARALGRDTVAGIAEDREDLWRQHTQVAIGHFRRELKALRDRATAASVTTKSPAIRLVEQGLAEVRLEQTLKMAELLLSEADFDLLVDALELRKYVV